MLENFLHLKEISHCFQMTSFTVDTCRINDRNKRKHLERVDTNYCRTEQRSVRVQRSKCRGTCVGIHPNPPLLPSRKAESQSLLDRKVGGCVPCASSVTKCTRVGRSQHLLERALGPRDPPGRLLPCRRGRCTARCLAVSLGVVPGGRGGALAETWCSIWLQFAKADHKFQLHFCGEPNSYRKKIPWVWPSWPGYYCCSNTKWEKCCFYGRLFTGKQTSCHL